MWRAIDRVAVCYAQAGGGVEGKENRVEGAEAAAAATVAAKSAPDAEGAWDSFCRARLDPLAVAGVLRATSSPKS